MKNLSKILSAICIIVIAGCISVDCPKSGMKWDTPPKPISKHVNFEQKYSGLYLDTVSSSNLLYNINEMQAYQKNLETLIEKMKSYYDAK